MQVIQTELPGVLIVEPKVFGDSRGFFFESWNGPRYEAAGMPGQAAQDNISFSARGVLRGLHFQNPEPQGKLLFVLLGEIFDVAVDIRRESPTFGRWVGVVLSAENKRQLYVPEGFAHGFCVTSEQALITYKCNRLYRPEYEAAIAWDDPDLGIRWPISEPTLAPKDRAALKLREFPTERLPGFPS